MSEVKRYGQNILPILYIYIIVMAKDNIYSVLNSLQSYRTENIYKPTNETNNKQMITIPQYIMRVE